MAKWYVKYANQINIEFRSDESGTEPCEHACLNLR
jgi:hypothetical protein